MEKLAELYNDPKFGLHGKNRFKKKLKTIKEFDKTIDEKQFNHFFDNNPIAQLYKPVPKPTNLPIVGVPGAYQGDLIFYPKYKRQNKGYDTILILVNINSRYAYGKAVKGKSQRAVNEAMESLIDKAKTENRTIFRLETDNGSEFISKSFQAIMKKNDIDHRSTTAQTNHNFLGKIDRFSRTIKSFISKYMSAYNTVKWVDVLPDLLENYNTTEHRAIGAAPSEITEAKEAQINSLAKTQLRNLQKGSEIHIGDQVRIPVKRNQFEKEGATYSANIYTVDNIIASKAQVKNKNGNMLKTKYNIYQLQKVHEGKDIDVSNIEDAKRQDKSRRFLRREGLVGSGFPDLQEAKKRALQLNAQDLQPSTKPDKRFMVNYNGKWIHFGSPFYDNFLIHKDEKRRQQFHARFRNQKGYNNPNTATFWSSFVLW